MHYLHVHNVSPERDEWEATIECPVGGETHFGGWRVNHDTQHECTVIIEDEDGESYLGYCQFHYIEDHEDIEGLFPPSAEDGLWPLAWPICPGRYPITLEQANEGTSDWTAWAVVGTQ